MGEKDEDTSCLVLDDEMSRTAEREMRKRYCSNPDLFTLGPTRRDNAWMVVAKAKH